MAIIIIIIIIKHRHKNKYSPPADAENGRRVIDGKPMWYAHKAKRWVPDKKAGQVNTASPSPPAPAPPVLLPPKSAR